MEEESKGSDQMCSLLSYFLSIKLYTGYVVDTLKLVEESRFPEQEHFSWTGDKPLREAP